MTGVKKAYRSHVQRCNLTFKFYKMKNLFLLLIFQVTYSAFGQVGFEENFWVISEKYEEDSLGVSNDATLNSFMSTNSITNFRQVFPYASTPQLLNVFEMHYSGNLDALFSQMTSAFGDDFHSFRKFEITDSIAMYDPDDYLWGHSNNWLWFLEKIEADKAWDITLGDPNVVTGVIDTDFDITHPDLNSEFVQLYETFAGLNSNGLPIIPYGCANAIHPHGTHVASLVSAHTKEVGSTAPSGQLSSIGFNTKMLGYRAWVTASLYLEKALYASSVDGVEVLTSSAGGWTSCPDGTGMDELIVKEILDNGNNNNNASR
jgi:subtilisin family serine protease